MSTGKRHWSTSLYWLGVALVAACFGAVLAGNTNLLWRFEHAAFPLSWALAAIAVLVFLAYEFCHSVAGPRHEPHERRSRPPAAWEPTKF